ncbi:hypothetical protein FOL47_006912 [Perkinsus chesapeaki]|uniref:Ribosomal RNA methyltransferase FtsJ domain-containing protein n=1 Tax=Perkinsus chesapeaki TaxID=330153 RepID=A0A7J6LNM3_PERCH|nr:hypothetical protein FOL47_006912 [Perkinsus chesapeaki]
MPPAKHAAGVKDTSPSLASMSSHMSGLAGTGGSSVKDDKDDHEKRDSRDTVWALGREKIEVVLKDNDPEFRDLCDEKELGWQSRAVTLLWERRKKNFQDQELGSEKATRVRFTPEEKKYFEFYRGRLPHMCPEVFVKLPPASGDIKSFVDIGSAPGGMSKFLLSFLHWTKGHAFSLAPEDGGLEMRYHNASLDFECANLADSESYKKISEALEERGFKKHSLDFINLGVVIDVGQCDRDDDPYITARKSIEVCRNQFLLMLDFLKPGGSCMWIHSGSHLDTYLFYLNWLNRMFRRLRVTNTLVPSRSPVYTIAENFLPDDSPAAQQARDDFREFLLSHPADPSTPEIWQVTSWPEVQTLLNPNSQLLKDLHAVWREKREKLAATRINAERSLKESCGGDESLYLSTKNIQPLMKDLSGVRNRGNDAAEDEDVSVPTEQYTNPRLYNESPALAFCALAASEGACRKSAQPGKTIGAPAPKVAFRPPTKPRGFRLDCDWPPRFSSSFAIPAMVAVCLFRAICIWGAAGFCDMNPFIKSSTEIRPIQSLELPNLREPSEKVARRKLRNSELGKQYRSDTNRMTRSREDASPTCTGLQTSLKDSPQRARHTHWGVHCASDALESRRTPFVTDYSDPAKSLRAASETIIVVLDSLGTIFTTTIARKVNSIWGAFTFALFFDTRPANALHINDIMLGLPAVGSPLKTLQER